MHDLSSFHHKTGFKDLDLEQVLQYASAEIMTNVIRLTGL